MDLPCQQKKWGKRTGHENWNVGGNMEGIGGERKDRCNHISLYRCMEFSRIKKCVSKDFTSNFLREIWKKNHSRVKSIIYYTKMLIFFPDTYRKTISLYLRHSQNTYPYLDISWLVDMLVQLTLRSLRLRTAVSLRLPWGCSSPSSNLASYTVKLCHK